MQMRRSTGSSIMYAVWGAMFVSRLYIGLYFNKRHDRHASYLLGEVEGVKLEVVSSGLGSAKKRGRGSRIKHTNSKAEMSAD